LTVDRTEFDDLISKRALTTFRMLTYLVSFGAMMATGLALVITFVVQNINDIMMTFILVIWIFALCITTLNIILNRLYMRQLIKEKAGEVRELIIAYNEGKISFLEAVATANLTYRDFLLIVKELGLDVKPNIGFLEK